MKSIVIVIFSLALGAARVAFADDVVRSNAVNSHSAQPSGKVVTSGAQPATGVRKPSIPAGKNQIAVPPNLKTRQNYPALARPIEREPLAMNVQRTEQNYRPTEMAGHLRHGHRAGPTNNNVRTGSGNNQALTDNRRSYFEALKRCRHERHDRNWWNRHCRNIVFVNTGYYYLDTGYWYPAYGYNSTYDSYDYDGPIYTYSDLLPDQVIVNVQAALREAGYYVGPITGSLGPDTRLAIANFQRDYGLIITGAIDEPTVQSLGLN
jgi:Putative peptidoglycan binding domain